MTSGLWSQPLLEGRMAAEEPPHLGVPLLPAQPFPAPQGTYRAVKEAVSRRPAVQRRDEGRRAAFSPHPDSSSRVIH